MLTTMPMCNSIGIIFSIGEKSEQNNSYEYGYHN